MIALPPPKQATIPTRSIMNKLTLHPVELAKKMKTAFMNPKPKA